MINKIIIVGRVGKDVDSKVINNGTHIAKFSVATNKKWTDAEGKRQEKTQWHRVVAWRKLGEICGKYVTPGSLVYVEGELESRSWDDNSGEKRITTEVIAEAVQILERKESKDQPTPVESEEEFPF